MDKQESSIRARAINTNDSPEILVSDYILTTHLQHAHQQQESDKVWTTQLYGTDQQEEILGVQADQAKAIVLYEGNQHKGALSTTINVTTQLNHLLFSLLKCIFYLKSSKNTKKVMEFFFYLTGKRDRRELGDDWCNNQLRRDFRVHQ